MNTPSWWLVWLSHGGEYTLLCIGADGVGWRWAIYTPPSSDNNVSLLYTNKELWYIDICTFLFSHLLISVILYSFGTGPSRCHVVLLFLCLKRFYEIYKRIYCCTLLIVWFRGGFSLKRTLYKADSSIRRTVVLGTE